MLNDGCAWCVHTARASANDNQPPPGHTAGEVIEFGCPHVDGTGLPCTRLLGHHGPHRSVRWEWDENTGMRRKVTRWTSAI